MGSDLLALVMFGFLALDGAALLYKKDKFTFPFVVGWTFRWLFYTVTTGSLSWLEDIVYGQKNNIIEDKNEKENLDRYMFKQSSLYLIGIFEVAISFLSFILLGYKIIAKPF